MYKKWTNTFTPLDTPQDDLSHAGKISQVLHRITTYQAGIAPNVSDVEKEKHKPVSHPSDSF